MQKSNDGWSRHILYSVFGLFPTSGILENTTFRICFRPQVDVGEKTPTQLGPLERANLSHWLCFPECQTMEKVQKPSTSVCYTPSSEPFRIYILYYLVNVITKDMFCMTDFLLSLKCLFYSVLQHLFLAASCRPLQRWLAPRSIKQFHLQLRLQNLMAQGLEIRILHFLSLTH
jgi:hypothetical protein